MKNMKGKKKIEKDKNKSEREVRMTTLCLSILSSLALSGYF